MKKIINKIKNSTKKIKEEIKELQDIGEEVIKDMDDKVGLSKFYAKQNYFIKFAKKINELLSEGFTPLFFFAALVFLIIFILSEVFFKHWLF
ncbi:MAG: hypothetical protein ACYCSW_09495 [bacterium]